MSMKQHIKNRIYIYIYIYHMKDLTSNQSIQLIYQLKKPFIIGSIIIQHIKKSCLQRIILLQQQKKSTGQYLDK